MTKPNNKTKKGIPIYNSKTGGFDNVKSLSVEVLTNELMNACDRLSPLMERNEKLMLEVLDLRKANREVLKEKKAQLLKEIDNLKFILNEDGIDTSWTKELKKKVEDVFAEALTPKRGILK